MAVRSIGAETRREKLCRAIVQVLGSWPAEPRRIFILYHYEGRSIEEIAAASGLSPIEAHRILATYERKLRRSLKSYRTEAQSGPCVIEPAV
jgi:DNA-directed RNA polymerase specialized sigma24 family protein